jgi:hypothetical protein
MSSRGPLDQWQERLERHFNGLAATRSKSGHPVFALEHGLTEPELAVIPRLLDHQLRTGIRIVDHWLVWAVYAAESGYRYDGHEYWQSFEDGMPRWRDIGRRDQLRIFFRRFHKQYNGFVPTGAWANHFSNICWPISHAILPRYFQEQFARAMFDARHQLARTRNATAEDAGDILARNAWDASKRFQEFLEQPALAGRIVQAMLGQRDSGGVSPLSEPTLSRLVSDLNRIRNAGEWLKATRQIVNDRFSGVYKPRSDDGAERPTQSGRSGPAVVSSTVRPELLLYRTQEGAWSPVVEVPTFADIAKMSADLTRFLQTTRCTIAGTGGALLPGGWTLYGAQRRSLQTWPSPETLLISFEKPHGTLDNILKGECRMSLGPVWLFRVGSDGIGRQVLGQSVRPGHRYILLSRAPIALNVGFTSDAKVICEGVSALFLDVPESVDHKDASELYRIRIQVSRSIRVWPAGLCAPKWDGDGHAEWLSTEEPCIGIHHDHPVEDYIMTLNDGAETRIGGAPAGRSIFVRLPQLQPGRHVLAIRPKRAGIAPHAPAMRELEGRLEFKVRDPRPRKLGLSAHTGLVVSVDPVNPSLAEFWDGSVRLSVLGPESREIRCRLVLTGPDRQIVLEEEVGRFHLPLTAAQWAQKFRSFVNATARAWAYLSATQGRFVVSADDLGEFTLNLERSTTPLRWACRFIQHRAQLKLLDDTGSNTGAIVRFYPFRQPFAPQTVPAGDNGESYDTDEQGGLYQAIQGTLSDVLCVSNAPASLRPNQLLVIPDLRGTPSEPASLLDTVGLWNGARLAGPLADSRRARVVSALLDQFYLRYCGMNWIQAEQNAASDQNALNRLKQLVDSRASYAAVLHDGYSRLDASTQAGGAWFADVSKRYGACDDPALCVFALQLAGSPFALRDAYRDRLPDMLARVGRLGPLLRGARYLAVLSAIAGNNTSMIRLPRWTW